MPFIPVLFIPAGLLFFDDTDKKNRYLTGFFSKAQFLKTAENSMLIQHWSLKTLFINF